MKTVGVTVVWALGMFAAMVVTLWIAQLALLGTAVGNELNYWMTFYQTEFFVIVGMVALVASSVARAGSRA